MNAGYDPAKLQEFQVLVVGFVCVTWAVLSVLFAWPFKHKVVDRMPKIPRQTGEVRERKLGLFACFSNQDACQHAAFCPAPAAARVMEQSGVTGYWTGFAVTCVTMYGGMCCQSMECFALPWRMWTMWRYTELMNYEADFISTFGVSCCCWPCEVGRQTMEVDLESGRSATCVCQVREQRLLNVQPQQQMRDIGAVA